MKIPLQITALAVLSVLTGCSSQLDSLSLQGSASVSASSVQVDVVGLSPANASLKDIAVSGYWHGGAAAERGSVKHFRFGPGMPQVQTVTPADPIWKVWENAGVKEVMIIADLPGVFSDMPGSDDPRRKIIPISSSSPTATIMVDKAGLMPSTP